MKGGGFARIEQDIRPRQVHLLEVGGQGGVFQHAAACAEVLADQFEVVLHTAADPELQPEGVSLCRCIHWQRRAPRRIRQGLTVVRFLFGSLPHLASTCRRRVPTLADGAVFVHGASPLCAVAALIVRAMGCYLIYSPHNTFSRRYSRMGEWLISTTCRRANRVVAYSKGDVQAIIAWGANDVRRVDLIQYVPQPSPGTLASWRSRAATLAGSQPVVGFFGQLRPDKRADLFIRAVELVTEAKAIIVGPDRGSLRLLQDATAGDLGRRVYISSGYLPIEDFVAAMQSVSIVVAPYDRASQSGVLSLAHQLGLTTITSSAGGLPELGDFVALSQSPEEYARLIRLAASADGVRRAAWSGRASLIELLGPDV